MPETTLHFNKLSIAKQFRPYIQKQAPSTLCQMEDRPALEQ